MVYNFTDTDWSRLNQYTGLNNYTNGSPRAVSEGFQSGRYDNDINKILNSYAYGKKSGKQFGTFDMNPADNLSPGDLMGLRQQYGDYLNRKASGFQSADEILAGASKQSMDLGSMDKNSSGFAMATQQGYVKPAASGAQPTGFAAIAAQNQAPANNLGFGVQASVPTTTTTNPQTGISTRTTAMTSPVAGMATQGFTQDDWQRVARMGGYTGPMGQGQHGAWLKADPTGQRQAAYDQAMRQYQGQYAQGGGVELVGRQEPLHDWEKAALSRLAAGPSNLGFSSDAARESLNRVGGPFNAATYMNPYIDSVVNANATTQNRQAEEAKTRVRDYYSRIGGTGSTAEARALAQIEEGVQNNLATLDAQLRQQGYGAALGQYNADATRNMNLSSAYQGLGAFDVDNFYRQQQATLGAGQMVRGFNQQMLDLIEQERLRKQGYPVAQMDFLRSILGAYPTGSVTSSTQPGNAVGGALGGALLGSALGGNLGFGGANSHSLGSDFISGLLR